jgi:mannose-6-phosphate isomerase-like protein (cupin superfamily)
MAGVESRSLSNPEESRTPEKTRVDVVHIGDSEVGRYTFQPGWKWSECIKPLAKTDSCQVEHLGYIVSGRLHVTHNDGTSVDLGPGDAYLIRAGHDGWVVGNEPVVSVEFKGAGTYAKA